MNPTIRCTIGFAISTKAAIRSRKRRRCFWNDFCREAVKNPKTGLERIQKTARGLSALRRAIPVFHDFQVSVSRGRLPWSIGIDAETGFTFGSFVTHVGIHTQKR